MPTDHTTRQPGPLQDAAPEPIQLAETKWSTIRPRSVEATVGVPGASTKLTYGGAANTAVTSAETAAKLEKVIRYLERTCRVVDFSSPGLQANQWVSFDLDMTYGTGHEDSAIPEVGDDIVLFGGSIDPGPGSQEIELLLCGSVNHLRDRIASSGRMGSGSDWLYEVIKALEERDRKGIHVVPEFLTSLVHWNRPRLDPDSIVREVFGGLMRSAFPAPDRGRLRGIARVLRDIDDDKRVTRLILGTPLYVEIPPPRRIRQGWRRLKLSMRRAD
ncbi:MULTISPECIES: SAVMC3_10250 family protein [unclassified Amycolatopsis]|nr:MULTISPECIES: SAVMC3_10250 family protein [unclassified Amycolatopsis]